MVNISLDQLNSFELATFCEVLHGVYEHSPWVIKEAFIYRPFSSLSALQKSCKTIIYNASYERQIELIRAHPDLAAKLDHLEELTEFSQAEQTKAGFIALPTEQLQELRSELDRYRNCFGHPFILCLAEHSASDVLPILRERIENTSDREHHICIYQIARIGWHRLCSITNVTF